MATRPQPFYTLDEYFALEKVGDARYEYWDGDIVCMSGGSPAHNRISGNIYYHVRSRLTGNCEAFTSDQAVKNHVATAPPYFYPDTTVACGESQFEKVRGISTLLNPTVLVEVTSPESTEKLDRDFKLRLYRRIPTLQEYLIIAQDKVEITRYLRQEQDEWLTERVMDLDATIIIQSIGCRLVLRDVYANIDFSEQTENR
ncbi:MAG: Uma2 family endonuclease [Acidobacteriota bacterium]